MSGYKVEICGVNTSKLPLLSNEEKEVLFKRILDGDKKAREDYIKGNLRLVLSVIQRFSGSNENVDDLFQIGCIGLIKAIDNFDITQNVRFSTYAVPMILGEVRRYLRDNNSIRVSRSLRDTAYKAIYAKENLMKKNLKEPTLMEIADEIGVSKEDITYALDAIQSPVSLYEPVYSDGGDPLFVMDQISDKKNLEENWVEDISLNEAMRRFRKGNATSLTCVFFEGKTQTEVAEEIHISQAQVSRLEKKCVKDHEKLPFLDTGKPSGETDFLIKYKPTFPSRKAGFYIITPYQKDNSSHKPRQVLTSLMFLTPQIPYGNPPGIFQSPGLLKGVLSSAG